MYRLMAPHPTVDGHKQTILAFGENWTMFWRRGDHLWGYYGLFKERAEQ